MKETMTLYEVLEVPANASPGEIRSAYRQIQSIYDKESLSTYSLFNSSERKAILEQAEQAFITLTDAKKRRAYDDELVARGTLAEKMCYANTPEAPAPVFQPGNPGENGPLLARMKEKANRPEIREMKEGLMAGRQMSGAGLKALRRACGISLTDIFETSRVSVSILRAIEEEDRDKLPADIYLKGFLKSYAECLGLDPDTVVSGYVSVLPKK